MNEFHCKHCGNDTAKQTDICGSCYAKSKPKQIDLNRLDKSLTTAYHTAFEDGRVEFACGILLAKDIANQQFQNECARCSHYNTDRKDQPCCGCVDKCNFEKCEVEEE